MMGRNKIAWLLPPLAAAALLGLATAAQAEEMMSGVNLRIEAGGGFVTGDPDVEIEGLSGEVDTGTGYAIGGAAWLDGLLFEHLSVGAQYLHMAGNDADSLKVLNVTIPGSIEPAIDAFMVNAALRKNDGAIHPYVGGGIGIARSSADAELTATVGGQTIAFAGDDSDTTLAGQFFAGIDFDVTENIYIGLNGRYFITNADLFGADVEFRNVVGMGVVGFKL